MDKIYGFRQKDVEELIEYLKQRKGEPLTNVFADFAEAGGKSKGTIRNMYYALARKSREDAEFTAKFLDGKPLTVQKIAEFNADEERDLVKKILEGRRAGRSARSVITELAEGDARLALRYQNKYRNVLRNKSKLTMEIAAEIRSEKGGEEIFERRNPVSERQLSRLKKEIDLMLDRIAGKLRRENAYLRDRLDEVENENMRLRTALYGSENGKRAADYFKKSADKNILN